MLPFQKIKDFITDISGGSNANQDGMQSTNSALHNGGNINGGQVGAATVNGSALRQDRKRSSWNDLTSIFRLSIKDNDHNQQVRFDNGNGVMNGQMMQGQPGGLPYNQVHNQQYQGKPPLRQNGQHHPMSNGGLGPKRPILTSRNSAPNLSQYQYNGSANGNLRHGQQRQHGNQQQQLHRRQNNALIDNFYPGDATGHRSLTTQQGRQQQHPTNQHPHHHHTQNHQQQHHQHQQQQQQHLQLSSQQRGHNSKLTTQTKANQPRGHQTGYNQQQQHHNSTRYDQYSSNNSRQLQQTNQQSSQYHTPQYGSHQSLTTSIPISSSSQPTMGIHSPRTTRRPFPDHSMNSHRSSPRTIPDGNNNHLSTLQGRNTVGSAPSSFNYNRHGPLDQLSIDGRLVNGNDPNEYGNTLLSPMMARHNRSHHCSTASINSISSTNNSHFNTISTPANSFLTTTYSASSSLNGSRNNISNYGGHRGLNSHDLSSQHDGLLTSSTHHHDDLTYTNGRVPTGAVNRDDINKAPSSKPRSLLAESRRESFRESKGPTRMRPISPSQHYLDDTTLDRNTSNTGQTQEYYDQMIAQINDQIAKAVEQRPYRGFGKDEDENDWC